MKHPTEIRAAIWAAAYAAHPGAAAQKASYEDADFGGWWPSLSDRRFGAMARAEAHAAAAWAAESERMADSPAYAAAVAAYGRDIILSAIRDRYESAEEAGRRLGEWAAEEAAVEAERHAAAAAVSESRDLADARAETLRLIRAEFPGDCPEYARADLAGISAGTVWETTPSARACYVSWRSANIVRGGDDGDVDYDLGDSICGEWVLAPRYIGGTSADQGRILAGLRDEVAARKDAEAAAAEAARLDALRQAGIRAEAIKRAASAEEEKRLRDIATIRRDWRSLIDNISWRNRSAHNGGECGYHPEAQALMGRIRTAQFRARELREIREAREREETRERLTRAERAAKAAAKVAQDKLFNGGAWSALDSLKF